MSSKINQSPSIGSSLANCCGDIIWTAGFGREQWQQLLPELEQMLRDAGCVMCRPIARPGWSRYLKKNGYQLKHIIMEKPL